ncbi:MAG: hypothetical protein KC503_23680 [Myxococcales bacterium]|nr:hypothetical protein [Myxococcales bacterium]
MNEHSQQHAPCDAGFGELIDQLFIEETLPEPKLSKLHEHVKGCDDCRAHYNRVVLAARLFHGGPEAIDEPSPLELARVREAVLSRARLAPDPPPRSFAQRFLSLRWLGALVAVGAAVAIVLPLALRDDGKPPAGNSSTAPARPEFQTRGAAPKTGKLVGLRAFCVAKGGGVAELGSDNKSCALAGVLKLAYTNRSKLAHVFIVGVDAKHRPMWYVPTPRTGLSVRAEQGAVDKALARTVRLEVNHQAGALRIFALFSQKPLALADVEAAIAKTKGQDLASLELLPLDDTEQRSLLVTLSK